MITDAEKTTLTRFRELDARDPHLTLQESAERDRAAVKVCRQILKWCELLDESGRPVVLTEADRAALGWVG